MWITFKNYLRSTINYYNNVIFLGHVYLNEILFKRSCGIRAALYTPLYDVEKLLIYSIVCVFQIQFHAGNLIFIQFYAIRIQLCAQQSLKFH